jgi:hypothetical protein
MALARDVEVKILRHLSDMLQKVDKPEHGLNPHHIDPDAPPKAWDRSREAEGDFPANIRIVALPSKGQLTERLHVAVAKADDDHLEAYLTVDQFTKGKVGRLGFTKVKSEEYDLAPLFKEIAEKADFKVVKDLRGAQAEPGELHISRSVHDHITPKGIDESGDPHKGFMQIETRATFADTESNRAHLLQGINAALRSRTPAPRLAEAPEKTTRRPGDDIRESLDRYMLRSTGGDSDNVGRN